jgi:Ca2+-binding EF-hand superfamily protein
MLVFVSLSITPACQEGDEENPPEQEITTQPPANPQTPGHQKARMQFIPKLEAKLGQPLTPEQKKGVALAAQEFMKSMRASQSKFVQAVSAITDISEEEIGEIMPKIGQGMAGGEKNMISKLEATLGRKLTPEELQKIAAADQERKNSMAPVFKKFANDIAATTGLPMEQVLEVLPQGGLQGQGQQNRRGRGNMMANMFQRFDKNKDGKLSKNEVPAFLWKRFSRADADHDSMISKQEFENARKKPMGRPEGKPEEPPEEE